MRWGEVPAEEEKRTTPSAASGHVFFSLGALAAFVFFSLGSAPFLLFELVVAAAVAVERRPSAVSRRPLISVTCCWSAVTLVESATNSGVGTAVAATAATAAGAAAEAAAGEALVVVAVAAAGEALVVLVVLRTVLVLGAVAEAAAEEAEAEEAEEADAETVEEDISEGRGCRKCAGRMLEGRGPQTEQLPPRPSIFPEDSLCSPSRPAQRRL